ncbi:MAG: hypothetical protein K8H84_02835 [Sulfuricella denitrificans]|nr:hypothetical protein [Sulfuricella denitrificans]
MTERPLSAVPIPILALLTLALVLQIYWGLRTPLPQAKAQALPPPPNHEVIAVASFGESIVASQSMALYLQAFDNQPGISIPFQNLDYATVIQWLDRMLELDSRAQYPLLMATHLYTQVPDPARQKQMLEFTYRHFFAAPDLRWQWLAHAAIVAKHRLHDLPLALKYSRAIARHANGPGVPHWAQQMPIFILQEMGETESAKILLGGLLANNTLDDPHEIRFLTERLKEMETGIVEKSPPLSKMQQD